LRCQRFIEYLGAAGLRHGVTMPAIPISVALLVLSNVFMTFAWYAHLKNLSGSCRTLPLASDLSGPGRCGPGFSLAVETSARTAGPLCEWNRAGEAL
jgi:hypothetical protein